MRFNTKKELEKLEEILNEASEAAVNKERTIFRSSNADVIRQAAGIDDLFNHKEITFRGLFDFKRKKNLGMLFLLMIVIQLLNLGLAIMIARGGGPTEGIDLIFAVLLFWLPIAKWDRFYNDQYRMLRKTKATLDQMVYVHNAEAAAQNVETTTAEDSAAEEITADGGAAEKTEPDNTKVSSPEDEARSTYLQGLWNILLIAKRDLESDTGKTIDVSGAEYNLNRPYIDTWGVKLFILVLILSLLTRILTPVIVYGMPFGEAGIYTMTILVTILMASIMYLIARYDAGKLEGIGYEAEPFDWTALFAPTLYIYIRQKIVKKNPWIVLVILVGCTVLWEEAVSPKVYASFQHMNWGTGKVTVTEAIDFCDEVGYTMENGDFYSILDIANTGMESPEFSCYHSGGYDYLRIEGKDSYSYARNIVWIMLITDAQDGLTDESGLRTVEFQWGSDDSGSYYETWLTKAVSELAQESSKENDKKL